MADLYPPDYTSDVGQVRLLIPDSAQDDLGYLFNDEQIEALLSLSSGNIKRAAALGKDTIATDQVLLMKVVRTDDLSVDGAKMATELRLQAKALRDQADAESNQEVYDFFKIVYPAHTTYPPEATPRPFEIPTTF